MSLFSTLIEHRTADLSDNLEDIASRCIVILWPVASPKIPAETLVDCFAVVVGYSRACAVKRDVATRPIPENVIKALKLVVTSYRTALANSSNKKKV